MLRKSTEHEKILQCQECGHYMGRSRVKMTDMTVRCNKCKTVFSVTLKLTTVRK